MLVSVPVQGDRGELSSSSLGWAGAWFRVLVLELPRLDVLLLGPSCLHWRVGRQTLVPRAEMVSPIHLYYLQLVPEEANPRAQAQQLP